MAAPDLPTIHIGFSGTQKGLTRRQLITLQSLLFAAKHSSSPIFHHGDCIGADAEAHKLAADLQIPTIIHPPLSPLKRAYCEGRLTLAPRSYLARNQDIVDASTVLIACPSTTKELLRSGTWSTIRRARKAHLIINIITPDGILEH